jgi:hypothetical protein
MEGLQTGALSDQLSAFLTPPSSDTEVDYQRHWFKADRRALNADGFPK